MFEMGVRKSSNGTPHGFRLPIHCRRENATTAVRMTNAVIFFRRDAGTRLSNVAAFYMIVRNAPPQPQRQSYRRHRPWNFK
jgi:hypothetical protein